MWMLDCYAQMPEGQKIIKAEPNERQLVEADLNKTVLLVGG